MAVRLLSIVLSLSLLPFLTACSPNTEKPDGTQKELTQVSKVPMWKISDENTTILMLPGVQGYPADLKWMDDGLRSLILGADIVFLEIPLFQPEDFDELKRTSAKYAAFQGAEAFYDSQNPEVMGHLKAAIKSYGLPVDELMQQKPKEIHGRLITAVLALDERNAFTSTFEDVFSLERAGELRAVGYLMPADQFSKINYAADVSDQMEALTFFLQEANAFEDAHKSMTKAWLEGNLGQIENLLFGSERAVLSYRDSNYSEVIVPKAKLIAERTVSLLPVMDGTILVLVDVSYFVGKHSILKQIEQAGIKVEKVH